MKIDLQHGLNGKVALVTGGLSGIGRATVDLLLEHGVNVAFTYKDEELSSKLALKYVNSFPEKLSSHLVDLLEPQTIRDCFAEVRKRWGSIDILINNAALGSATVEDVCNDGQGQDSVMLLVNSDGTLKMCQEFLADFEHKTDRKQRKIVNVSAVGGGVQIFPGFRVADGMSKSAVSYLTKHLAAEHVHTAVDIFAICPGATDTPMFQKSTLAHMDDAELKIFLDKLPKQRLIDPAEIAAIIVFLASEYSTAMHGYVIDASMGLGVRPGLMTEYKE